MRHEDLPPRWREQIEQLVQKRRPSSLKELSAYDFPDQSLKIEFPDGSQAKFEYAFAIELGKELGVFTEHCGYHIFPSHGLEVEGDVVSS